MTWLLRLAWELAICYTAAGNKGGVLHPSSAQCGQRAARLGLHWCWTIRSSEPGFFSFVICCIFKKFIVSLVRAVGKVDPAVSWCVRLFGMCHGYHREQLLKLRLASSLPVLILAEGRALPSASWLPASLLRAQDVAGSSSPTRAAALPI